jgi:hypothetical protein
VIKSIVMHDIPLDAFPAMERWYHREHAAEIARRYGPWLARHESYLPVPVTATALDYGFYNWRLTECWWREVPLAGPRGALSFTPPPEWPRVAACFVPAQPTHDFCGSDRLPGAGACLRWLVLFRYPAGVTAEQGDQWFLNVHAPEVARQPGLRRFFAAAAVKEPIRLPGEWAPGQAPPPDTLLPTWDWAYELWYDDFSSWRAAVAGAPTGYTPPPWATTDAFPFVACGRDFVSTFLLERPSDEFVRDLRAYLP